MRKLLLVWLCFVSSIASAQSAVPANSAATSPVLVLIATSDALNPALDVLCGAFATDLGGYRNVVRLQSSTNLSGLPTEISPGDQRSQKGAMTRLLQGLLRAQAFQSCRDGVQSMELAEPLEVALFEVTFVDGQELNLTVNRYAVDEALHRKGAPLYLHVNLFRDLEVLSQCVGRRFWNRQGAATEEECTRIDYAAAPSAPVATEARANDEHPAAFDARVPPPSPPVPPPPITARWWFWTAIGVVVASSATAIAIAASSHGSTQYPSCSEGFTCPR